MPAAKSRPDAETKGRAVRTKRKAAVSDVAGARVRGIDTSNNEGAALVSPDKPLSEMQKLFVRYWAQGETILSASYKAGYADGGTYAYRMVRMPNVLRLYNEEKRLYEEAAQMSRKKVMDMLMEAYEVGKLMQESSSMTAAAREMGKMCGYYEPVKVKIDVNHTGKVLHDRIDRMSTEELLQFMAAQAGAIRDDDTSALPAPD